MQGQLRGPSTEAECPIRALVRIVRPTRLKLRAKMRQRAQGPTMVVSGLGGNPVWGKRTEVGCNPSRSLAPRPKAYSIFHRLLLHLLTPTNKSFITTTARNYPPPSSPVLHSCFPRSRYHW